MAMLRLTDNFGLIVYAKPSVGSFFSRYLKSPEELLVTLRNIQPIKQLAIGNDPFQAQSIGFSFNDAITLGNAGVELTIDPQVVGSISISKGSSLFDSDMDPFQESIAIPAQHAFVAAALDLELDVTPGEKNADLQFSFTPGTTVVIANYRLFPLTHGIMSAVQSLFEKFVIPGDFEDVEGLAEHDVVTLDGTGSLKLTATASLLTSANPLATLNTGIVPVRILEGTTVTVKGTYTLTGSYQLRIERLDSRKFRLGYQKRRTSEFDVTVQAHVSAEATAGGFELISTILHAVSADPVPNKAVFNQAGLTHEQISTVAAAVKAGVERSIALSLSGELDALDSSSTAFSYEIDIDRLDANSRKAVHDALNGDLTGIEEPGHHGITPLKSIVEGLRQGKRILRVNLLGIFNHGSVVTLFQKGTLIVDRETGDITITDQAGASRLQFTAENFAQDSVKLRRVLAESLLITAAYRCSATISADPQLSSHYWFFELHQNTTLQHISDYLNVAQALELLTATARIDKLKTLRGTSVFGRSTVFIDASYTDELCREMFIDAKTGHPRPEEEYESIGRRALFLLLSADDSTNGARRLPLADDVTWNKMKTLGQPGFSTLFAPLAFNANQIADITSDYTLIRWWATSMHRMGQALAQMIDFIATNPAADREDNTFKKLRSNLEDAMTSVVSNTQAQFGEPWGILALDLASGQRASTTLRLVSPRITAVLTQRIQRIRPGVAGHGD